MSHAILEVFFVMVKHCLLNPPLLRNCTLRTAAGTWSRSAGLAGFLSGEPRWDGDRRQGGDPANQPPPAAGQMGQMRGQMAPSASRSAELDWSRWTDGREGGQEDGTAREDGQVGRG